MKSAVQLLHERIGGPVSEGSGDHEPECCSICGGLSSRGVGIAEFISKSLTDQNTFRFPTGRWVCEACAFVRGRFSAVPGREPKDCDACKGTGKQLEGGLQKKNREQREAGGACVKCEGSGKKESGGRFGNFSHFMDEERYENASKGEKPKILDWLRGQKYGSWFCVIADSGQKHLLPYAPLNPPGSRGRIRFEEQELPAPSAYDLDMVSEMTELLTAGVTKEELLSGQYTARAYQLAMDGVRAFEKAHSGKRQGTWFSLAVWLAQRDEERVAVRMEAEAARKEEANKKPKKEAPKPAKEKKSDQRRDAGEAAKPHRGDGLGGPEGVPSDEPSEHARALEDRVRPDADRVPDGAQRGPVVDERPAPSANPGYQQGLLFDLSGPVGVRPREGRVEADARPAGQGARASRSAGKAKRGARQDGA